MIKTARCILEPATIEDKTKEFIREICAAKEFEWYYGIEKTAENVNKVSINRNMFFNIFDKNRNFIGYIGFHLEFRYYAPEIYIVEKYRRQGYACECLRAVLIEVFKGNVPGMDKQRLSKIVSRVRIENTISCMLMAKCGFERDGDETEVCVVFPDGNFDKPLFSIRYFITSKKVLGGI